MTRSDRSLHTFKQGRQGRRQAHAMQQLSHSLIEKKAYDRVHEFVATLDHHDLGHLCRQILNYLVTRLKANKAVMLVDTGSDSFQLFGYKGFSSTEVIGVGYVATYTPFCRKLLKGKPFEYSHTLALLDELNRSSRLFYLKLRYWIPIVITEEDRLIGIIGIDVPSQTLTQQTYSKAFCQFTPYLVQNAIINYRMRATHRDSRFDNSTQEKLQTCLHTTRRLASTSYRNQEEIISAVIDLLEINLYVKRVVLFTTNDLNEYTPKRFVGINSDSLRDLTYTPSRDIFCRMLKAGKFFDLQLTSLEPDSVAYALVEKGLNFFIPFVNNDQRRTLMGFAAVKLPVAPNGYQLLIARFIALNAALALRNLMLDCELYDTQGRHEHQINKLQMLYDVGRALSVIDNRTELLKKILGHATDIVQAEKGSVMLLNNNRLEVNVVKGIDEEIAEKILHGKIRTTSLALGEGIAGTVALTGQPMLINDVSSIQSNKDNDTPTNKSIKFVTSKTSHVSSILCVPLRAHNEVIGVINITNKKQRKDFTTDDLRIVEQVADQAAVAIHNARLYELAITDSLTKVFVRHQLFIRLDDELKRLNRSRDRKAVTVIMLDIDFFKSINDRFGHPFGDKVLVKVTEVLRSSLRAVDSICRYGGEEFCVILPETDLAGGKMVARRFSRLLEKLDLQTDSGTQVRVSVSGGVASCRNFIAVDPKTNSDQPYKMIINKMTVSDLIKQADVAMYYSKQHGRNQFTAFEDIRCRTNPTAICTCEKFSLATCRAAKQAPMVLHTDHSVVQKSISPNDLNAMLSPVPTSGEAESCETEQGVMNAAHNVSYESDMRSYTN